MLYQCLIYSFINFFPLFIGQQQCNKCSSGTTSPEGSDRCFKKRSEGLMDSLMILTIVVMVFTAILLVMTLVYRSVKVVHLCSSLRSLGVGPAVCCLLDPYNLVFWQPHHLLPGPCAWCGCDALSHAVLARLLRASSHHLAGSCARIRAVAVQTGFAQATCIQQVR